jgi:two-component system response regulator FlrC
MSKVLIVTDEPWVRNEVRATLTGPDFVLIDHASPDTAAAEAVAKEVDVVITDLQIAAMGGMAVVRSVREATGDSDTPGLPVILLLDRKADGFLAKRSGAAAWLTKPFTSHELAAAIDIALERGVAVAAPDSDPR